MKNKSIWITLGLALLVSFTIYVLNGIYSGPIPKIIEEINNGVIGAILGALITFLLLNQQSASLEIKERNVKVFEEKSSRFNKLIEMLWEAWQRGIPDILLLDKIHSYVITSIIIYAPKKTTETLLNLLAEIADLSVQQKKYQNANLERAQNCLREMVNVLTNEIALGGEITDDAHKQIIQLNVTVVAARNRDLIEKSLAKEFSKYEGTILKDFGTLGEFFFLAYGKGNLTHLFSQIDKSDLYLCIGPVDNIEGEGYCNLFFQSDSDNGFLDDFRLESKGWMKEVIGNFVPFSGNKLSDLSEEKVIIKHLDNIKLKKPLYSEFKNDLESSLLEWSAANPGLSLAKELKKKKNQ